ncbi:hypothetical protein VHP8226_03267 [Vibrio hippocampi]|uniref:Potassium-transporting ATPase subunit F n=1 Tax=Vibrio hippocampi TaxID=654686 RepID=A0ABM8ZLV9_9VIBR|nr:hypothetical protein VHP8226_03267 [Vibrio hippocampi]
MSQTDIWMIGVIVVGFIFYGCTVYFGKRD